MAIQFATIEQFYAFQGLRVPDDIDEDETLRLNAVLMRASDSIRRRLRLAVLQYDRNTGLPASSYLADEIARATAAQAVYFEEGGSISGAGADFDSATLNGVSFSKRAGSVSETPAQKRRAAEALAILEALPIWTTRSRRG